MTFDQQVTILVALRIYRQNCAEQVVQAPYCSDYFSNEVSRIDEAEKVIKAMEVQDAERK